MSLNVIIRSDFFFAEMAIHKKDMYWQRFIFPTGLENLPKRVLYFCSRYYLATIFVDQKRTNWQDEAFMGNFQP